MMLQLDFVKAYDRVDHAFIWAVMQAFGFDPEFIDLVKGLITNATTKFHFNGLFSDRVAIERGVRQGCPLAPLLFSLTTQSLMDILNKHHAEGKLQGIDLDGNHRLLCQLFVHDTVIFFTGTERNFLAVMDCLQVYERLSGMKVNLEKSKLIQLDNHPPPTWMSSGTLSKNLGPPWYPAPASKGEGPTEGCQALTP
jgi:hypothetical protein